MLFQNDLMNRKAGIPPSDAFHRLFPQPKSVHVPFFTSFSLADGVMSVDN